MAATDAGRGSWAGRSSVRSTEATVRETWLGRSTMGADEEDLWSQYSDDEMNEEESEAPAANAADVSASCGKASDQQERVDKTPEAASSHTRPRKLTLGRQFDSVRGHALRKAIPPVPVTPAGMSIDNSTPRGKRFDGKQKVSSLHAKRSMVAMGSDDDRERKMKEKDKQDGNGDGHMTIYMDYEREEGFGKKRRGVFVIRQVWNVHAALFLSTACVHCVSFNVSPALRRLFRIEGLPVGLCIVVAWTILGLVNCLGAWVGRRGDRVVLLRTLSWLWIAAIGLLQLAKVLPVASVVVNTFVGVGYVASVAAHGLMVPSAIAIGADLVAARAVNSVVFPDDEDAERRQQQSIDLAMGTFLTWVFGTILAASSVVQAFYFAAVQLDLATGDDSILVLRSQRSVFISIPCYTLLLALLATFLFQSRHHVAPVPTESSSTSPSTTSARNTFERKLAHGDLASFSEPSAPPPSSTGVWPWFQLARRSAALLFLGFSTLVLLVAVSTALIAPAVVSSTSTLVHLVVFAVLTGGWALTMLVGTSQLAPSSRDKLYGHMDDLLTTAPRLPSRHHLFVLVALVCLASAAAFAAFVRAQLYVALFVQTCQLRRPHDAPMLYDPNVLGVWVGVASVVLLPLVHVSPFRRVSGIRRVVLGVLLYLVAIFLSSVVELYRRASRWPSSDSVTVNPAAAGCVKRHASNLSVLWNVPHLIVLAAADAVFRIAANEEAFALTAPLAWRDVAMGMLALADSIGYAATVAMTKTLSPWLTHVQTSDLVLLLLLITAIASLAYALTKRLADHVHASRRRQPTDVEEEDQDKENDDDEASELEQEDDERARHRPSARALKIANDTTER